MDILALGEVLIDFTTTTTDKDGYPTMAAHPGGAPANFLAALNKFGFSTGIISKVGNDAFGKLLVNTLSEAGISVKGLTVDDTVFTTLAFVTLDENGDRDFSFARKPGADTCIKFEEIDTTLIDECKVFHFGTLSLTDEPSKSATEKAVVYAKKQGKLISFDPNLRKPLWNNLEKAKEAMLWGLKMADVVKISDEEVEFLFGLEEKEAAEKLLNEFGVKIAFVTLGPKGAYFANKNACGYVKAPEGVKVVDTTGAGDIFGGSAMSRVLKSGKNPDELNMTELTEIAAFASASASLSTEKFGGIQSVPDEETVKNIIK